MKFLRQGIPVVLSVLILAGCNPTEDGEEGSQVEIITDGNSIFSSAFATDRFTNALVKNPWYAYNLQGGHGIYANYRVFAVLNEGGAAGGDDIVTLFQMSNYYSDSDVSGHITVRYRQLEPLEAHTINEIELDASAGAAYLVFDESGTSEGVSTSDFDLAFSRTSVTLGEDRQVALAAAQSQYYNSNGNANVSVFTNANSSDKPGKSADVLAASYDINDLSFTGDEFEAAINREGTSLVHGAASPNANVAKPENRHIVRSAEGDSFAKMSVKKYTYDFMPNHTMSIEVDFFVQGSSEDTLSDTAVTWTATTGGVAPLPASCFDFDSGSTVSCSGNSWDVQLTGDGTFLLNGGVSDDGEAAIYYGETM